MAFLHSHNDHDLLWNAIASGVSDNDANTRQLTRLTYWGLQQTFPQKAEEFAHTLSIQHKKQVCYYYLAEPNSNITFIQ